MVSTIHRIFFQKTFCKFQFLLYFCTRNCGVEQLVARRAHNPEVASSSPAPATKLRMSKDILFLCSFAKCYD